VREKLMLQSGLAKGFFFYERVIRLLAGASTATIVTVMVVQVIARYVFNSSLIWAEELCRYVLIWQTFLFIGYAYHQGELVVLDLFSARTSPRLYLAIRILTAIPISIFLYFIITAGIGHAMRYQAQIVPAFDFIWTSLTGDELKVPIFWIYVAVPVGCVILLAHFLARLVRDAWCVATGQPLEISKSAESMS
jgi:TRAP-type C4-dicarboxylate transport system permease small subunit